MKKENLNNTPKKTCAFLNTMKSFFKGKGRIKNQALLRKGSYTLMITAIVLCILVLVNVLTSVLSNKLHLEIDLSQDKKSSINGEIVDYIKGIKQDVTITVCADRDNYANYMSYYAQQYNAQGSAEYYDQTIKLLDRYDEYSNKIEINYVDPQTSEFTAISQTYSSFSPTYGDIIVTSKRDDTERVKKIGFKDIYVLTDESGYAAQGYGAYTISGNGLETALTGAVSYVLSDKTKTVGIITGHSTKDYTASYTALLKDNNYDIVTISEALISSIPEECDMLAILSPDIDFLGSEIDVLANYLDNGGKMGKGLVYFADATCPQLPNFNEFLRQWGIGVENGILFETDGSNHIEGKPTAMGMYPTEADDSDLIEGIQYCITDYNVPMYTCTPADARIEVSQVISTLTSAVVAPNDATADWKGYSDSDKGQYSAVIESHLYDYENGETQIDSYVFAFSSVEFIESSWAEYSSLSNKDITLRCTDRAAGVEDTGISFLSKTISTENFSSEVTQQKANAFRIIFMVVIPVMIIAAGIYVYIRRRNAQ